ncbi:MAG: 4-hydroxy-3-methylbut-2-enyl diphosphate reductase [Planctomycetes bacterium]|nr:4-hydroxy-3-methylbut-2-enyl diphosphate reductase [Planctomycetota bacterium]
MEVVVASALGMCFGVKDAIELAAGLAREGPVTILGALVHNPQVVADLAAAGASTAHGPDDLPAAAPVAGDRARVLVTAHGAAASLKARLAGRGFDVRDATCPLVDRAHRAAARLAAEGRHVVVVGRADHVEVRGLVGDLPDATVLESEADLERLAGRPRLGVLAQTTEALDRVLALVARIRERFPRADVAFADTVCQPTKDRQLAVAALVLQVDAVVVVGGPESNNTHKLVARVHALGRPAWRVGSAAELRPEWLRRCRRVGLTAGTSTPDAVIDEVRRALEALPACPAATLAPAPATEAAEAGAA